MKLAAISFTLIMTFGVASCSSDGSGALGGSLPTLGTGDGATEAAPSEPAAPETAAPEPAAPETAAPEPEAPEPEAPETPATTPAETVPDAGSTDDGDSNPWPWILLGVAALAIIAAIMSAASKRRRTTDDHRAVEAQEAQELAEVMAGCQWVYAQSPSILQISDPVQVRSAWDPMRSQILGVERSVSAAASRPNLYQLSTSLGSLGVALSTLRMSLEEYVGHAASSDTAPAVVESAAETVRIRNDQVAAAAAAVRHAQAGGVPPNR